MSNAETFIGSANETIACPDCGKETAIANVEMIPHDTIKDLMIPVGKCWSCGFMWSDYVAEEIIERRLRSSGKEEKGNG